MPKARTTAPLKKTADLERIRNNQRRCRARQKEHIKTLEEKIRRYESCDPSFLDNQKLDQLSAENDALKRLLHSLGLHNGFIEAYKKANLIAPSISVVERNKGNAFMTGSRFSSSSIPTIESFSKRNTSCVLQPPSIHDRLDQELAGSRIWPEASTYLEDALPWEIDCPGVSTTVPEPLQIGTAADSCSQLTVDSLMIQALSHTPTGEEVSETTTLCSWAFSLVLKSNSKNYNAEDLDRILREGYRCGATPLEGCRIDNKVLLNALAEIS